MPVFVLKDAEVPGDVVERLARLRLDAAGREGAGADPAAVRRVEVRSQKAEILAANARGPPGFLLSAFCFLTYRPRVEIDDPVLHADARGVWRNSRLCIEWGEIYAVSGHKLDLIDSECTIVELDFSFGESVELDSLWPGFNEVVAAITQRVSGIDPQWFDRIHRLSVDEPPIIVWQQPRA
jgi:hypothetical protein